MIKQVFEIILDFLFPRACFSCEKLGKYFCKSCLVNKIYINWEQKCHVCGRACRNGFMHSDCKDQSHLDGLIWFCSYDGMIKEAMHEIKYKGAFDVLEEIGIVLNNYLNLYNLDAQMNLVPVPLHKSKQTERGFNQSEILSKAIKMFPTINLLKRTKYTKTQTKLNGKDRQENLREAFKVIKNLKLPKSVLLVDDVYTTGATLNACAKVLKENGVEKVIGLVFAKARN